MYEAPVGQKREKAGADTEAGVVLSCVRLYWCFFTKLQVPPPPPKCLDCTKFTCNDNEP